MVVLCFILIALPLFVFEGAERLAYSLGWKTFADKEDFKRFTFNKRIANLFFKGKEVAPAWFKHIHWKELIAYLASSPDSQLKKLSSKMRGLYYIRKFSMIFFVAELVYLNFIK